MSNVDNIEYPSNFELPYEFYSFLKRDEKLVYLKKKIISFCDKQKCIQRGEQRKENGVWREYYFESVKEREYKDKDGYVRSYRLINLDFLYRDDWHPFRTRSEVRPTLIIPKLKFEGVLTVRKLFSKKEYRCYSKALSAFRFFGFKEREDAFSNLIEKIDKNEYEVSQEERQFLVDLNELIDDYIKQEYRIYLIKKEEENQKHNLELKLFQNKKAEFIFQFDENKKGSIEITRVNNDFIKLIKSNQKKIEEKGKNISYTQNLVKLNNYLIQKSKNLEDLYKILKSAQYGVDIIQLKELLEDELIVYNLLLFNSFNLLNSLLEDDMVTFYQIYEKLDQLGIFETNWEKQLSEKINGINSNLVDINYAIKNLKSDIRVLGNKIINSISDLTYVTANSNNLIQEKLNEIDSSIQVNNLFQLINTFQLNSVRKSSKYLREQEFHK